MKPAFPTIDAVTWVTAYVVVLYAIPSRLVVDALGSAGAPSMLFGLVSLALWILLQLTTDGDPMALLEHRPVRRSLLILLASVALTYIIAMSQPIEADEVSPADVALLALLSWSGTLLIAADRIISMHRMTSLAHNLALAGALMGALGLLQFITGDVIIDRISIPGLRSAEFTAFERGDFVRPSGTATHPIEFGVILAMLLPFALHTAFYGRRSQLFLRWLPVILLSGAVSLTLSRSAYVSAAAGLVVLMIGWPREKRRIFLFGGLAMGMVLFAAVPRLFGTISSLFRNVGNDPSIDSRTDSYAIAAQFISRSPIFGHGLGTFLPKYRIFDNQYLLLLVSVGIVGAAAFIALLLFGIYSGAKAHKFARSDQERDLALAVTASISAGAVSLTTFDAFAFPMTMGTLFLVLGMAGALYRICVSDPRRVLEPADPVDSRRIRPTRRRASTTDSRQNGRTKHGRRTVSSTSRRRFVR